MLVILHPLFHYLDARHEVAEVILGDRLTQGRPFEVANDSDHKALQHEHLVEEVV